MTNDAIKPCPFCGGDADIDEFEGKLLETVFAASCNNDDCPIGHKDHGSWPTKTDALNSWNTRAALAPVDVEGLKREVDEALSEFWGTDALYATNKASVHKAIDHLAARGFFGVWQPIETAPKDGTWIMVYWPTMGIGQYPFVVFWDEGWQPARYSDRDYGEAFPTHWMPLPAAPKKEGV